MPSIGSPWRFDPLPFFLKALFSLPTAISPGTLLSPTLWLPLASILRTGDIGVRGARAPMLRAYWAMHRPFPVQAATLALPRIGLHLLCHCVGDGASDDGQKPFVSGMMAGQTVIQCLESSCGQRLDICFVQKPTITRQSSEPSGASPRCCRKTRQTGKLKPQSAVEA